MISFVLKSANLLIISKLIVKVFFPSGNSYSLSFCSQFRIPWILCWDFTTHSFLPPPYPQHLASEQPSKFLEHKLLSQLKNGLTLKSPQKQRLLFGLNLYQTLLLGPKLLQKILFLQIRPIKPTSKESKNRRLKPCLNLQNQMKMRKTQP